MSKIRMIFLVFSALLLASIACESTDEISSNTPTGQIQSDDSPVVSNAPTPLDPVREATNDALLATGVITQESPGVMSDTDLSTTIWYMVGAQNANVRLCGSVDCIAADTVPFGQRLEVIETVDGWHRIRLSANETGWIAAYLTSQDPPAVASPTIATKAPTQIDYQDRAARLARQLPGKVESVQVFNDSARTVVIIQYEVSELADLDFIEWKTLETICDFRESGFTAYTVRIAAFVPVVDRYGTVSRVNGLMVVMSPASAARINCENTVNVDLEFVADAYDLHPVMR